MTDQGGARTEHAAPPVPVAVVGGGPVGLSLALGLARQGVRSVLLERDEGTSRHSKAPGIHVRTREALQQWGIDQRFLDAGALRRQLRLHAAPRGRVLASLDFSGLDTEAKRPGILFLEQAETERLLLEEVRASGLCDVRFGAEVVGLSQDGAAARLTIARAGATERLEAAFVAGCDGMGSFVREALGLPFDGITYDMRPMLADVRISDERDALPWPRLHNARRGLTATFRLRRGLWRIIRLERGDPAAPDDVGPGEVSDRVREVLGDGPAEVVWASRFRIHRRSAPRFRAGRVVLAGDAAHVHSPAGGQGLNAGVQDAHNLAWKLAHAVDGGDTDRLLDSYDTERREVVVGDVSRYADLLTRIFLQSPSRVRAGAFRLTGLGLGLPFLRDRGLRRTAMIDLRYGGSELLDGRERSAGLRLPNPPLRSPDGDVVRLYDLVGYRPALLEVAARDGERAALPGHRVVRIGPGGHEDPTGALRALVGGRDGWVLVRPDAHVAWARTSPDGMGDAVRAALGRRAGTTGHRA
jgi:2-polyprenyl-6-methoxyphenol hydroxylase-like FAD-dependent oxidoreductase